MNCQDTKHPNTHAHPHFHAILLVKPSYFKGGNYIKQMDSLDSTIEKIKVFAYLSEIQRQLDELLERNQ